MFARRFAVFVLTAAAVGAVPQAASAQFGSSFKTFVSQSGTANLACTFTQPCLTIAQAVFAAARGGVVVCLDKGDYSGGGATEIDFALTIDCGSTDSTLGAFTIRAPAGENIVFKHFTANGSASSPVIQVFVGSVIVDDVHFHSNTGGVISLTPTGGVGATATLTMRNVLMDANGAAAVLIAPSGGASASASIIHSRIVGGSGGGVRTVSTNGAVDLSVIDSAINGNAGNGINAVAGANPNIVSIKHCVIANNGAAGVQANGAMASVAVSTTLFDQNGSGATSAVSGGSVLSYGNNDVVGSLGSGFGTASQH